MGRRVPRMVLLCVSAFVTVAIFACAPVFVPTVLAGAQEAMYPPHQCGGG